MKLSVILLILFHIVSVSCDVHNNTTESQLGQVGSTALWVGVVSHSFASFAYVIASKRCKDSNQIYYHINIVICSIATTCYLLMAMRQSDYITEDGHLVFWARYVEFIFGTPLLLIDLCMMIRLPHATMFYICFMDILMIGAGWFATISTTVTSKWVLFILGCIFFYPILDAILGFTPDPNNRDTNPVHNRFVILYTALVWNGYVILWTLHDGFGWVSLDSECVIHTVLDILAKDLFGVVLLYNHIEGDNVPDSSSSNVYEMDRHNRQDNHLPPHIGSVRRSNTGPPIKPDRRIIRRSITGPTRSSREPQIVITPPVTDHFTPGQRRPSVSSDRPLTMSSDDSDIEISVREQPSPRPRQDLPRSSSPQPYREYEDTYEIRRPSRSRARSPSPRLPLRDSRESSPMPQRNDTYTPDYDDMKQDDTASQASAIAASPSRQNVLNRTIQTFDRIRRMI